MQYDVRETKLVEFVTIWNNYSNLLSCQPAMFDQFADVVNKIKQKHELTIRDKQVLVELMEQMADTIYVQIYKEDTLESHYQMHQICESSELNCCSTLIDIFQSEILHDLEMA